MKLLYYPDKALTTKCRPIFQEGKNTADLGMSLEELVTGMFEIMYTLEGLGLAAPQVGVLYNLFVAELAMKKFVFLDPEIETFGKHIQTQEGCLSLPDVVANLKCRKQEVKISAYDLKGDRFTTRFYGRDAIIVQHEFQHLQGHTLFEEMDTAQRTLKKKKYLTTNKGK